MSNIIKRHLPEVPIDFGKNQGERGIVVELRQAVLDLRGPQEAPTAPTNFKATALAFAVLLQWTRGVNSDGTHVYWNTVPSLSGAVLVDVGASNQHVDFVGKDGVTRYYWVQSYDSHSQFHANSSVEVGPQAATTLAAGTGVVPPTPPPAGQQTVTNTNTGQTIDRFQPGRGRTD